MRCLKYSQFLGTLLRSLLSIYLGPVGFFLFMFGRTFWREKTSYKSSLLIFKRTRILDSLNGFEFNSIGTFSK